VGRSKSVARRSCSSALAMLGTGVGCLDSVCPTRAPRCRLEIIQIQVQTPSRCACAAASKMRCSIASRRAAPPSAGSDAAAPAARSGVAGSVSVRHDLSRLGQPQPPPPAARIQPRDMRPTSEECEIGRRHLCAELQLPPWRQPPREARMRGRQRTCGVGAAQPCRAALRADGWRRSGRAWPSSISTRA
jgi:hypothetical protein